jgi:hypothetical protein
MSARSRRRRCSPPRTSCPRQGSLCKREHLHADDQERAHTYVGAVDWVPASTADALAADDLTADGGGPHRDGSTSEAAGVVQQ